MQILEIPTDDELSDVYSEGYYNGRDEVGYRQYVQRNETAIDRATIWLKRIPGRAGRVLRDPAKMLRLINPGPAPRPWPLDKLDIVNSLSRGGTLLDVGCAKGNFLAAARGSIKSTVHRYATMPDSRAHRNLERVAL